MKSLTSEYSRSLRLVLLIYDYSIIQDNQVIGQGCITMYKAITIFIVVTISLVPPLFIFHWNVRKYESLSQYCILLIMMPLLTMILSIMGINVAGLFYSVFMNIGFPVFESQFSQYFIHIWWLAPILVFIYCYVKYFIRLHVE